MLFLAGLLLCSLAFGTLVAPVFSLQFNFTSVQQCAPLLLSFSGLTSPVSRAPASLTIIPFNSTAIVLPLHDTNFSAGIALSLLPFAAGSEFIVSLDDANGTSIINNSDIFPVHPSPNNNSTCIPEPDQPFFTMPSPIVSQCQPFTVNYNTTVSSQAPRVRLYNPSGPSFFLNTTSDDPISGVATYTMAFSFGHGIALVMDNGNGTTETTPLLLVGGDSSSPTTCLSADTTNTVISNNTSSGTSSLTSRIAVITGATIGAVAVLFGICLAIFVLRKHRRRRFQNIQFDRIVSSESDSFNEKRPIPRVIVLDDPLPTRFDNNSVNASALSPEKGYYDRDSLLSWSQGLHEDQHHLAWSEAKQSPDSANGLSDPVVSSSPTVPQPTLPQPPPIARSLSKRHLRAPSDVPADLNSRVWSTVSSDSFYPSVCETEPTSLTAPAMSHPGSINGRSVGLPTSPRDGLRANISRAPSKRSNASTQGWYGIVR